MEIMSKWVNKETGEVKTLDVMKHLSDDPDEAEKFKKDFDSLMMDKSFTLII